MWMIPRRSASRQRGRAVVHVELLEDALDVRAGGVAADAQRGRDLLVPLAGRQQLEDLDSRDVSVG